MNSPSMTALVEDYLAQRRSMGFVLRTEGTQLRSFARFADAIGHQGSLTLEIVVRWATLPGDKTRRFPARRLDCVRPFARYIGAVDPGSQVLPPGLLGPSRQRPCHHIFTDGQIVELVAAIRAIAPAGGLRPETYATLFGLLASSGLRISEALRLERANADLGEGILTIRATKFRKSRLVPLHTTTTTALRAYAEQRDRSIPNPTVATFFISGGGTSLCYSTVRTIFRNACVSLGWSRYTPRPRIHDLRHTFACRRLLGWYDEGVDVAARIAALATYLGHAKISDTYWYLTGTPELLAVAANRFESFARTGARR